MKVWICLGDVLGKRDLSPAAAVKVEGNRGGEGGGGGHRDRGERGGDNRGGDAGGGR